jgi:acyl-CoA thioester hydrolase
MQESKPPAMNEPFTIDLQVRFRDLDVLSHVNNAVYASYLEQARAGYFDEVLDRSLDSVNTVLARLEIDFQAPIDFESTVTITVQVPRLGESSIPMSYEVLANDSLAATAETVQVVWDPASGGAEPIPEEWRRRIEQYEDL